MQMAAAPRFSPRCRKACIKVTTNRAPDAPIIMLSSRGALRRSGVVICSSGESDARSEWGVARAVDGPVGDDQFALRGAIGPVRPTERAVGCVLLDRPCAWIWAKLPVYLIL